MVLLPLRLVSPLCSQTRHVGTVLTSGVWRDYVHIRISYVEVRV